MRNAQNIVSIIIISPPLKHPSTPRFNIFANSNILDAKQGPLI